MVALAQITTAALSGLLWFWAYLLLLVIERWALGRPAWMPVHSKVELVHFASGTIAGIPCEELKPSGVDTVSGPHAPAWPWTAPRWWDTVWFRELAAVRNISDAELEAEVMGYAIARMRGAV